MPLPTQRLPFGASTLNRMVPATIEASEASVNRMPCKLSVPTDIRCQTMKPTPRMPSSSPATLRQVSASPRNKAASAAVNTGLAETIRPPRPAETDLQPGIAEAEIERVVGDAKNREHDDVAPRDGDHLAAKR